MPSLEKNMVYGSCCVYSESFSYNVSEFRQLWSFFEREMAPESWFVYSVTRRIWPQNMRGQNMLGKKCEKVPTYTGWHVKSGTWVVHVDICSVVVWKWLAWLSAVKAGHAEHFSDQCIRAVDVFTSAFSLRVSNVQFVLCCWHCCCQCLPVPQMYFV